MIFSSMTPDEVLKYGGIDMPDQLQTIMDDNNRKLEQAKEELAISERYSDGYWEQLQFAKELIEEIKHHCKHYTRAAELKAAIERSIENSYLEL